MGYDRLQWATMGWHGRKWVGLEWVAVGCGGLRWVRVSWSKVRKEQLFSGRKVHGQSRVTVSKVKSYQGLNNAEAFSLASWSRTEHTFPWSLLYVPEFKGQSTICEVHDLLNVNMFTVKSYLVLNVKAFSPGSFSRTKA